MSEEIKFLLIFSILVVVVLLFILGMSYLDNHPQSDCVLEGMRMKYDFSEIYELCGRGK